MNNVEKNRTFDNELGSENNLSEYDRMSLSEKFKRKQEYEKLIKDTLNNIDGGDIDSFLKVGTDYIIIKLKSGINLNFSYAEELDENKIKDEYEKQKDVFEFQKDLFINKFKEEGFNVINIGNGSITLEYDGKTFSVDNINYSIEQGKMFILKNGRKTNANEFVEKIKENFSLYVFEQEMGIK